MTRLLRSVWIFGLAMLLTAAPVLAQEGESSPADSSTGWIFRWVNFAIVLALIVWGFRRLAPYFRSHADEISRKIAEGARARAAAEQHRREAEARLANLDKEIEQLRADSKRDAQAEAQRLRDMARDDVQKIDRAAQAEIAAAARAAGLELKALAGRMAVERAEALLRGEIAPKTESALFQEFVAELDRSAN
jgi:F-type H+-transporting ATPase subunit b